MIFSVLAKLSRDPSNQFFKVASWGSGMCLSCLCVLRFGPEIYPQYYIKCVWWQRLVILEHGE